MERWHRADFALAGFKGEPAPARFGDAFLDAEKRLRRRAAEANQDVGIGKLDLPQMKGRQICDSCGVGVRLPGGRQGTMLAM